MSRGIFSDLIVSVRCVYVYALCAWIGMDGCVMSLGECEATSLWVIWCSLLSVRACVRVLFHHDSAEGDMMSQLSSTSLPFLAVMATLSREGSGDKVTIACYLLCD